MVTSISYKEKLEIYIGNKFIKRLKLNLEENQKVDNDKEKIKIKNVLLSQERKMRGTAVQKMRRTTAKVAFIVENCILILRWTTIE